MSLSGQGRGRIVSDVLLQAAGMLMDECVLCPTFPVEYTEIGKEEQDLRL